MFKVKLSNAKDQKEFVIKKENDQLFVDEQPFLWDQVQIGENIFHCIYENRSFVVEVVKANMAEKSFLLKINGKLYEYSVQTEMDLLLEKLGMQKTAITRVNLLKAPMPGLIVDVRVSEGQKVQQGDVLLVLEAMKMENAIKSPAEAIIKNVLVKKGDNVEKNKILVEFA